MTSLIGSLPPASNNNKPRQRQYALRRGDTERTVTEPDRTTGEFQRQGRGEGAQGEVPHRQIRITPDEPHPEAIGRRNVAVR